MSTQHTTQQVRILVVDQNAAARQLISQTIEVLAGSDRISIAPSIEAAQRHMEMMPTDLVVVAHPSDFSNPLTQVTRLSEVDGHAIVITVGDVSDNPDLLRIRLARTLAQLVEAGKTQPPPSATPTARPAPPASRAQPAVVVIAASTGGPDALAKVLAQLPSEANVPILIVQHMPAQFTPILTERLSRQCSLPVSQPVDGQTVERGHVYVAPGGLHTSLRREGLVTKIELQDTAPVNFCKPSADVLFASAASVYGSGVVAIVMTGMGSDGALGARAVSQVGGYLVAQDPSTATVASMPAEVVEFADEVVPLADLGARLASLVTSP